VEAAAKGRKLYFEGFSAELFACYFPLSSCREELATSFLLFVVQTIVCFNFYEHCNLLTLLLQMPMISSLILFSS
jgi:hypothetical protein